MIIIEYPGKRYTTKYVPTIEAFMDSHTMTRVLVGPWGSGKSVGCVMELLRQSMLQKPGPNGVRNPRWAVVRNTYRELHETTQKTFFSWLEPGIHGIYKVQEKTFYLNNIPCPDGAKINAEFPFIALDDPEDRKKLLSLELTGVWFNELKEISYTIFKDARGRTNRWPPISEGGSTWGDFFVIGDTNPPEASSDDWLYNLLEPEDPTAVQYPPGDPRAGQLWFEKFRQASGLSKPPGGKYGIPIRGLHAENLPYLSDHYYEDLCLGEDEGSIAVKVHGDYGYIRDGKPVYRNWNSAIHIAKEPITIIQAYPLIIGWDFGYQFSACVICQQLPNGQFNVKHELIRDFMDTRTFAREVVKPFLAANYLGMDIVGCCDMSGTGHSVPTGTTSFKELIDAGFNVEPSDTNDWDPRFSAVNVLLMKRIEGDKPAFQVDPGCKKLIKGFNGEYKYKRFYSGKHETYSDKPLKNEYSHLHDALQYACLFMETGYRRYRRRKIVAPTQKPLPRGAWT